jgi:hypothetical protein
VDPFTHFAAAPVDVDSGSQSTQDVPPLPAPDNDAHMVNLMVQALGSFALRRGEAEWTHSRRTEPAHDYFAQS